MTPLGHTAAGYLVSATALELASAQSTPAAPTHNAIASLILWGIFWSVAVDWDLIISMLLSGSVKISPNVNHRKFISHTPILWAFVAFTVYLATASTYMHYFALMIFLGSWFHFALDSIEPGIMWLWPFSTKLYSLFSETAPRKRAANGESFFQYYFRIFHESMIKTRTFRAEIAVIIIALIAAVLKF